MRIKTFSLLWSEKMELTVHLIPPTDRCPYELLAAELERELLMYATSELGEVRIMVCRSMLASDSGEMDRALFLLRRGVRRGLEKRDTANKTTQSTSTVKILQLRHHLLKVEYENKY